MQSSPPAYKQLKTEIAALLQQGRQTAARSVNRVLLETYWHIGRHIVEYEQDSAEPAVYRTALINRLSKDWTQEFGKGFSRSNLKCIRQLFQVFPKSQTLGRYKKI